MLIWHAAAKTADVVMCGEICLCALLVSQPSVIGVYLFSALEPCIRPNGSICIMLSQFVGLCLQDGPEQLYYISALNARVVLKAYHSSHRYSPLPEPQQHFKVAGREFAHG